jgi:crotonobetainyl-CoA:carnitine CoA-transferase CaiB-like acyl-CoA transferase
MTANHSAPLHGVRVLDLSRILAGPYCSMHLADLGAEVIKVEEPGRGDDTRQMKPPEAGGESHFYLALNRNKQGVALDLKSEQGREVLHRLGAKCDVLVENFRPGGSRRASRCGTRCR